MVNIISYQTGHDSSIVGVSNGKLVASIEGEKNSNARFYMQPSIDNAFAWLGRLNKIQQLIPDVICLLGWCMNEFDARDKTGVYFGLDYKEIVSRNFCGKDVDFFYSTHEKAHIFLSYALSPFPQGQPVYCLTWEGSVSALYKIDENMNIRKVFDVIPSVGTKYSFLFVLAGVTEDTYLESAGKIMALAAYATEKNLETYRDVIDYILFDVRFSEYNRDECLAIKNAIRAKFGEIFPCNEDTFSQEFKNFCWAFQERVLQVFIESAKDVEKIPLLISGGCGLNCYWNQRIRESGLFDQVFIPPCANDSGVAIGLAAEAQFHYTGNAKIEWDVYAGEYLEESTLDSRGFLEKPLSYQEVAKFLSEGSIIAWAQGRYEIGPRALCNRSLLAAPFSDSTRERLNIIKKREAYRPIAPVCCEEDSQKLFGLEFPSPHMLYFSNVLASELKAITHADSSARVQTVNKQQNEPIYTLLSHFRDITGYGVLCNTSLNYNGKGFINNSYDIFKYARERDLDGIVIGDKFYKKISSKNGTSIGLSLLEKYDRNSDSIFFEGIDTTNDPADSPALKTLEITDWSMYRRISFDLFFRSRTSVGDYAYITLYADHWPKYVFMSKLTNSMDISNGMTNHVNLLIGENPDSRFRLQHVSNVRFVICTEIVAKAELRISNVVFHKS